VQRMIVGLGLNVNWDESPPGHGLALNQVVGHPVDTEALLAAILRHLEPRARALDPSELLSDYRERSATLGRRVRVELFATAVEGTAVDVTAEGHLVIDEEGRHRAVAAGDVVHVRSA
jgi:BirA family biotin operon repressor/biotin-[acetyl-CoA-carboxylase] ligase